MIHVIGSGPAGIAAAYALIQAGKQVTLLDSGLDQDPANESATAVLRDKSPGQWTERERTAFRGAQRKTQSGDHLKTSAGSDYAYRERLSDMTLQLQDAHACESHAIGGLSNVWGATLLPFRARDLEKWPISYAELEPHYIKLSEFLPVTGTPDDLAELFPLFGRVQTPLQPSTQARGLLEHWSTSQTRLRRAGFRFGQSRLSVLPHCESCGLCTYGCPYGQIYSTRHTLSQLLTLPGFTYRKQATVTGLRERAGGVEIRFVNEHRADAILESERVFVACGPVASARLMLASMDALDTPIPLLQSQRISVPFLLFARARGIAQLPHHALAQAFLELILDGPRGYNVHAQLFGYNDLFREKMGRRTALSPLMERAAVLKCYFGSEISPPLSLEVCSSNKLKVKISGRESRAFRSAVRKFHTRLLVNARSLGGLALPLPTRRLTPGAGNHLGGSFPMSGAPQRFQSDTLGRIRGFTRIHVVDSSVFPSLPASTLAYSVMANSHRIASAVANGKGEGGA